MFLDFFLSLFARPFRSFSLCVVALAVQFSFARLRDLKVSMPCGLLFFLEEGCLYQVVHMCGSVMLVFQALCSMFHLSQPFQLTAFSTFMEEMGKSMANNIRPFGNF